MQLFQNSQVLDLSVFVPLPFVLPNLLRSSLLVLFVSHMNCSCLRIAKSFTQKLPLDKGFNSRYESVRPAKPTQYVARGYHAFSGHIYNWRASEASETLSGLFN